MKPTCDDGLAEVFKSQNNLWRDQHWIWPPEGAGFEVNVRVEDVLRKATCNFVSWPGGDVKNEGEREQIRQRVEREGTEEREREREREREKGKKKERERERERERFYCSVRTEYLLYKSCRKTPRSISDPLCAHVNILRSLSYRLDNVHLQIKLTNNYSHGINAKMRF